MSKDGFDKTGRHDTATTILTKNLQDAVKKTNNVPGVLVQHHFSQCLVLVESIVLLHAWLQLYESLSNEETR